MTTTRPALKTFGRVLLAALALALVASALLVASGAWWVDPGSAMHTPTLEIDGERIALAGIGAGHALALIVALALGLLVALIVVPVAVLVPLLLVAACLGVVLLAVLVIAAGAAAIALSPLLAVAAFGWLVWRLLRRRRGVGVGAGNAETQHAKVAA